MALLRLTRVSRMRSTRAACVWGRLVLAMCLVLLALVAPLASARPEEVSAPTCNVARWVLLPSAKPNAVLADP